MTRGQLARNLKIRFELLSIDEIYEAARRTLAPVFAGMPEDVTEENIQSRARGLLLMAMSNKFGALVLSTGNKSELAVGYCTLYGDMVGGLAVISDVPKTLVYRLSAYVNSRRKVIPEATIEKPPSAELRPDQKDSDSLPPYDVLDAILEDFVEDSYSVEQIASGSQFRSRSGTAGDPDGGAQRVQAAAGGPWNQDFRQGVRLWAEISDRGQGGVLAPRARDDERFGGRAGTPGSPLATLRK